MEKFVSSFLFSLKNLIPTILFMQVLLLLFCGTVLSSNYTVPIGGRSAGIGNTSVTFNDFWSVFNNQAGLAEFNSIAAGFYFENRFLVKELSLRAGAFVIPTKSGVFGVSLNYFGYSKYNEKKIGLAYGRSLSERFSVGVKLDYLSTAIAEDYGNKRMVTFELGIRSQLNENIVIAAHLFNPVRVKLEDEFDERIPTVFKLGISYSLTEQLLFVIETEKDLNFKPLIRGGIEYEIIEQASVRMGYSSIPSTSGSDNYSIASVYTFGFGLKFNKLMIDFSSSLHQILGWSPQVSIVYKFNEK